MRRVIDDVFRNADEMWQRSGVPHSIYFDPERRQYFIRSDSPDPKLLPLPTKAKLIGRFPKESAMALADHEREGC